jgi:hypothetical protein
MEDIYLALLSLSFRPNKLIVARINWEFNAKILLHENLFHVQY